MWKALIKLIESWAYRCEHNWEEINRSAIYGSAKDKLPHTRTMTYMCTKCGEHKKLKV